MQAKMPLVRWQGVVIYGAQRISCRKMSFPAILRALYPRSRRFQRHKHSVGIRGWVGGWGTSSVTESPRRLVTYVFRAKDSSYINKSVKICTTGLETREVMKVVRQSGKLTSSRMCARHEDRRYIELVMEAIYGIRFYTASKKYGHK